VGGWEGGGVPVGSRRASGDRPAAGGSSAPETNAVAWLPQGGGLAAAHGDGQVAVYSLETGQRTARGPGSRMAAHWAPVAEPPPNEDWLKQSYLKLFRTGSWHPSPGPRAADVSHSQRRAWVLSVLKARCVALRPRRASARIRWAEVLNPWSILDPTILFMDIV